MSNDLHNFSKFKHFPLELQGMIFKEAIPERKSPVVDFLFEITKNPRRFVLDISTDISPTPHLLPLLNACEVSRKEVYRQLKRVKISGSPGGYGSAETTDDGVPIRYFWKARSPIGHTYIDAIRDTLMLNIPDLLRLYRYGGSIDFSKITRIALTAFATDVEDTISDPMNYMKILDLIGQICPDLKVFQMVTMLSVKDYFRDSNPRADYRILDIETELWHTDFWDEWEVVKSEHRNRIKDVLDGAKEMGMGYYQYMALLKKLGTHEGFGVLEERLRYTAALNCRFDDDRHWRSSRKRTPEPRLYVLALDAWLPAYEDGTVLDKYKGLAQIFEGASW
ncbi:hypothetical protein DID88_002149 [Monilinia fructigena]|uniref:Uncharacterized protein n=1 Tax=Monilinia fructigena TaxID=38457 RepID=A0A395IVC5_9HELO|nr:hypothetical protein DID88_002149 [Monilinia fructigena]